MQLVSRIRCGFLTPVSNLMLTGAIRALREGFAVKIERKEGVGVLNAALCRLGISASAIPNLRIELPAPPEVRMRNLVNRGAMRPVLKVSSIKMERVIQCESLLEADLALLLDASPNVDEFAEQALRINYLIDGAWRTHIPDFAVFCAGTLEFCEVKYGAKVDAEAIERERLLKPVLADLGACYQTRTESQIGRVEVGNAFAVLRRARHVSCPVLSLSVLEQVRKRCSTTLGAFGWRSAGSSEAACLARLIVQGKANVDWSAGPLTDESRVWLVDKSIHEEKLPWQPALSV